MFLMGIVITNSNSHHQKDKAKVCHSFVNFCYPNFLNSMMIFILALCYVLDIIDDRR